MPDRDAVARANEDLREDKSPEIAAGEFAREEIKHVMQGKTWCKECRKKTKISVGPITACRFEPSKSKVEHRMFRFAESAPTGQPQTWQKARLNRRRTAG
jgi:hypothetical protein